MTFQRMLDAARRGEAWACARIYEDLKRPVLGYVRLQGARDPDDVTSEVFLSVFRSLDRFEGAEDDFRAWVFTIARRRIQDAWRKRIRRPRLAPLDRAGPVAGGDVQDEALASLSTDGVVRLLDVLTAEQREVVLLRIVADLPVAHVAEVMGRTEGSVRALQHRALNALRRHLDDPAVTDPAGRAIPWER